MLFKTLPHVISNAARNLKKTYYVYILANKQGLFYTGVTNNLERRIIEHKSKLIPGFTLKYNITRLMYFCEFGYINDAIEWEKKVKDWRKEKKIALIKTINFELKDLAEELDFSSGKPDSK